jgi:glycosyltransferase involved in cell wall biosynthesis
MDEPLHILHIETGNHLYGGALQVLYLMEGLAKEGLRNTLVCARGSAIGPRSGRFASVFEIPMRGEMDPGFPFHLLRAIRESRPHLVHVHSRRGADLWGGLAAKLHCTKAVITRRVDNPEAPLLARAKYGIYDHIITISEEIRRVLLSEGIPESKLTCIPSAVDCRRYERKCDRQWFLSEFGLDPGAKAVGVIAQLIPRKGHRFVIEAAHEILRACPETEFLFFGQGPLRKNLEAFCLRNHLEEKIHFPGFRKDLERILPCLYMVVHPATREGLGVSLLQASAAGIPVVAFKAGGIPEIVKEGQNGYLTSSGDVNGIAQAAITLLKDPARTHRFGRTGRKLVRTLFSPEAMVKGNLAVYHQVIENRAEKGIQGE